MRGIVLIIAGVGLIHADVANAQNTGPVTLCDRYAASPFDPNRNADGVPFDKINPTLAIPACEDAVRKFPASDRLISELARAYYKSGDFGAAFVQNQKAANHGNAVAQYNLGAAYLKGEGTSQNFAEAVRWLRKAADQGSATAQYNLGTMYAAGQGVPLDYAEAMKWYRKSADQGFDQAENNLGAMYAKGQGVAINDAEADKWYRRAASKGNIVAQNNLKIQLELHEAEKTISTPGSVAPGEQEPERKYLQTGDNASLALSAGELKTLCTTGLIPACEIYLRGVFDVLTLNFVRDTSGTKIICPQGAKSNGQLRDYFLVGSALLGPGHDQESGVSVVTATYMTAMSCKK